MNKTQKENIQIEMYSCTRYLYISWGMQTINEKTKEGGGER